MTAGTASTTASSSLESWTFAALSAIANGMPLASVNVWYLLPGLPRSTGLGPVCCPPVWPVR
jgi:hypothetical protein